jgi:hypothetical protein
MVAELSASIWHTKFVPHGRAELLARLMRLTR